MFSIETTNPYIFNQTFNSIALDSCDRKFYCTENHKTGCFILQRITCY